MIRHPVGKLEKALLTTVALMGAAEGKNLKMRDVSAVSLASQRLAPWEPRRDTALTAESAW
jgi:hypothetical protein